jgi:hypothetical protein
LPKQKVAKNDVIILRDENPDMTMADMGRNLGVSRERIRQILKSNNKPTKTKPNVQKYFCPRCGKGYKHVDHFPKKTGLCNNCFLKLPLATRQEQRRNMRNTY